MPFAVPGTRDSTRHTQGSGLATDLLALSRRLPGESTIPAEPCQWLGCKALVRRNSPMVLGFPGLYRPVGVHLAPSGLELVLFLPQANGRGL